MAVFRCTVLIAQLDQTVGRRGGDQQRRSGQRRSRALVGCATCSIFLFIVARFDSGTTVTVVTVTVASAAAVVCFLRASCCSSMTR